MYIFCLVLGGGGGGGGGGVSDGETGEKHLLPLKVGHGHFTRIVQRSNGARAIHAYQISGRIYELAMADSACKRLPRIKEVRAFVKKASGDQGNDLMVSWTVVFSLRGMADEPQKI